jgi:hypothetical protein
VRDRDPRPRLNPKGRTHLGRNDKLPLGAYGSNLTSHAYIIPNVRSSFPTRGAPDAFVRGSAPQNSPRLMHCRSEGRRRRPKKKSAPMRFGTNQRALRLASQLFP